MPPNEKIAGIRAETVILIAGAIIGISEIFTKFNRNSVNLAEIQVIRFFAKNANQYPFQQTAAQ